MGKQGEERGTEITVLGGSPQIIHDATHAPHRVVLSTHSSPRLTLNPTLFQLLTSSNYPVSTSVYSISSTTPPAQSSRGASVLPSTLERAAPAQFGLRPKSDSHMPMSRPHQAMSQRPAVHRISHPFAADYIPGSFSPLHSSSLDPSTRSSPRRAPKPVASKPTPVTPQRRRFVSEAPPKTPVPAHDPAPIPLSTPPPRSAPSDPQPPSAHSPRGKRRLIRPDSRVHRDRKKSKKTHYWELKPISKHDPVWKGLYTLEEVNEAWVRAREEFLDRSNRFERNVSVDSPATSIATKHEVSSSPDYHILSARASSQLLVPTPEPELASKAEMTTVNELPVSQSDQQGTFTPPGGFEDPFDLDSAWIRSLGATPRETLSPNTHRPPPLNLLRSYKELPTPLNHTHPYAYQEEPSSMSSATRMKLPDHPILLSPLPIPSPGVWEARRVSAPGATSPSGRAQRAEPHVYESELRWAQNCAFSTNAMVDLESAMEELLASAGERRSCSSCDPCPGCLAVRNTKM
ncbi:hypothetical protein DB88DRAFT_474806 [Papiliotrema laurentii]|uniref:Uncharacterized protein n=1 Tax=Papiliotrema laurentii TaxID=5418 RepID=A0AAD9FM85_PAPLA|nr:hypothetical protein DB88DRAFT_474806 [Papiliotrema laurentii]